MLRVCLSAQAQPADVELRIDGNPVPPGGAVVVDGRLLIADTFAEEMLGFTREPGDSSGSLKWFGHQWQFRAGQTTGVVDGQTVQMDVAPQLLGGKLYCPAGVLLQPLGAAVERLDDGAYRLRLPRAMVTSVRQGLHEQSVRIVIDLSGPAAFSRRAAPGRFTLRVPLPDTPEGRCTLLSQHSFADALVPTVTESRADGWAEIAINHSSPRPPSVFTLAGPERIVVDFARPAPVSPPQTPAPPTPTPPPSGQTTNGVQWRACNFGTEHGPVTGWLLQVDPGDEAITVGPAAAGATIDTRRTVKSIAAAAGAYAAVNGGYFASTGQPLGMLLINGEWIASPRHQRAVLGFCADRTVQVRNVAFDGWVEFEGLGRLPLEGVNTHQEGADGVVVYTPRWGASLSGNARKTRVVVRNNVVTAVVGPPEAAPIPADGYVVSGLDKRATSLLRVQVGQGVKLLLDTSPKWPGLLHAVGGGPRLLAGGAVAINTYDERFRPDITCSVRPRTAAGVDARGRLLLLVIDSTNRGMTLGGLATVMQKLGAVDALNLDGGGSSSFVVDGTMMNTSSDGFARTVSDAIIIRDARRSAKAR
jgi:hypothetical protein